MYQMRIYISFDLVRVLIWRSPGQYYIYIYTRTTAAHQFETFSQLAVGLTKQQRIEIIIIVKEITTRSAIEF